MAYRSTGSMSVDVAKNVTFGVGSVETFDVRIQQLTAEGGIRELGKEEHLPLNQVYVVVGRAVKALIGTL